MGVGSLGLIIILPPALVPTVSLHSQVSKANFKLLLLYLDGLCGNQRVLAGERAGKVATQNESDKDKGKGLGTSMGIRG